MIESWAAVVLAGGRARRLGGADKPGLRIAGRTLLEGVLAACAGAEPVVVVGPRRATGTAVRWVREEPPHGGPLAALAAGLLAVPAQVPATAVLAADLPNLRAATVLRLRAALFGADAGRVAPSDGRPEGAAAGSGPPDLDAAAVDGAVLVDRAGQPQWLCGVWRTAALRAALDGVPDPAGRPLRAVLGRLAVASVPADGDEAFDVDTADDLRALRARRPDR